MMSVKAQTAQRDQSPQVKPVFLERKAAINWQEAYDILQCKVESLQRCSEIPPVKPKSGEVYLFCATDDKRKSKLRSYSIYRSY